MSEFHANDSMLNEPAQKAVQGLVREMPEDTPSLTWRSDLNLRLAAVDRSRKKRKLWMWSSGAAASMAAATLGFFLINVTERPRHAPSPNLESSIVSVHRERSEIRDVTGVGLSPDEARPTVADEDPWSEADLGAL